MPKADIKDEKTLRYTAKASLVTNKTPEGDVFYITIPKN